LFQSIPHRELSAGEESSSILPEGSPENPSLEASRREFEERSKGCGKQLITSCPMMALSIAFTW
jgi:hypothetical protein